MPLELEHLVADTLEPLRHDLALFATPQEASEAAAELEKKYRDKIGDSLSLSLSRKMFDCFALIGDWGEEGEEEEEEEEEEERGGGGSEVEEEEDDDEEEGDEDEVRLHMYLVT